MLKLSLTDVVFESCEHVSHVTHVHAVDHILLFQVIA